MRTVTARSATRISKPTFDDTILSYDLLRYQTEKQNDPYSNPEFSNILHLKQEHDSQIEAQDALNEVAAFEQKLYGKKQTIPQIQKTPLSKQQEQILDQYCPSRERELFGFPTLKVKNHNTQEEVYIQPSSWNIVEPFAYPQRNIRSQSQNRFLSTGTLNTTTKSQSTSSLQNHAKRRNPFFVPKKPSLANAAIPLLNKDLISQHKNKMNQFNQRVRIRQTYDNQIQEERHRRAYYENKNFTNELSNRRTEFCANLGQKWAIDKLRGPLPPKPKVEKPSAIDVEALSTFNRREGFDAELEKEKKRRSELSNIPNN